MANIQQFQQRFLEIVEITDPKKKYLKVKALNILMQMRDLKMILDLWVDYLIEQDIEFDSIAGLADAGNRFSTALALEYMTRAEEKDIAVHPTKKNALPGSWKNIVTYDAHSFTTDGDNIPAYIGEVTPGMKVLLVDDVIAKGDTAVAAIHALQEAGVIVVGLVVIFDKLEQGGMQRIEEETGVKAYSLVTVEEVSEEGIRLEERE